MYPKYKLLHEQGHRKVSEMGTPPYTPTPKTPETSGKGPAMKNSRGQSVTVPTPTIIEAIRRARVTQTVGVKDNATGETGVALFSGTRLRIILTQAEMQAVTDLLTVAEMETLFTNQDKDNT